MYTGLPGLILAFCWGVFSLYFWFQPKRGGAAVRYNRVFFVYSALTVLMIASLVILLFVDAAAPRASTGLERVVSLLGLVVVICGQLLMVRARRALRRLSNFDLVFTLSAERSVEGPYSYLPHPLYLGLTMSLVGSSVVLLNQRGIALSVAVALLLWLRARIESAR